MNSGFASIRKGLEEAVEYAKGNRVAASVRRPFEPDIKAIRDKIGMNQNDFASTLGISLQTLRYWEQGKRKPRGPVLVLLNIMEKAPQTVMDLLSRQ